MSVVRFHHPEPIVEVYMKVNIKPYPKYSSYLPTSFYEWQGRHRVNVHIDDYDTWSLDCTLSGIILPALEKFKEVLSKGSVGVCEVADEDVPSYLIGTKTEDGIDEFYIERWLYILDRMIMAHWMVLNSEDVMMYYIERSKEGLDRVYEEAEHGMHLFAKYYRGLWN